MEQQKKYEPIQNYGIIGDLHTVALVSLHGSVDFFSFTRFDSPTVFASLLDADNGGCFRIHPRFDHVICKQMYLPDTAVLLTRFFADEGIAELTDYMPVNANEYNCALIRKVTTIRGTITFEMDCKPRFDYGRSTHHTTVEKESLLFEAHDTNHTRARLVSNIPVMLVDGKDGHATFELKEGEAAYFIFEAIPNKDLRQAPIDEYINQTYNQTKVYWQQWIEKSAYKGRWREIVNRSAITLKLLTSMDFGSVIAAPTFGLPESIGGERNWDYRFTWIRDASFTMFAFLRLGFKDEAAAFLSWIRQQIIQRPLQLMYAVDGETELTEIALDNMEGYMGSKPVRIGNKAHEQFQLDIYGELIDTIYLFNKDGGAITYEFWIEICEQVDFVTKHWMLPDHGIWEIRNQKREFLHSRVMCWVAMDRAIKIAESRSFPYPMEHWHQVRDDIFNSIYKDFWSEEKQSFIQHKGSKSVDASALLMPLKRFISPYEMKWKKTMEAISKELQVDVLVYRYNNDLEQVDGLKGEEGTFTMCSFWYVECLAKSGRLEEAREQFDKMLGYANHLGLFSEELSYKGDLLGNFPQAFTHLGLISAALELNRKLEKNSTPDAS